MTATDRKEGQKYGFDWGKYLTDQKGEAAPVQLFGHVSPKLYKRHISVSVVLFNKHAIGYF